MLWTMSSVAAGALQIADPCFVDSGHGERILSFDPWRPSPRRRSPSSTRSSRSSRRFSSRAIPQVTFAIDAMALVMVAYSVANTRETIARGRRRLAVEWQAKKALNFVDEFENSGRGWFWETDSLGTLSYVSRQLAEDFQCEPGELLGRQFTDLLSVDTHTSDVVEERKTLGFHLSARFPFSDVVVRPASEQDVHWSLSGNPIFDERGRFLGFRGIGTDLTEQRRSEQEISRLARFNSLTSLPNRAMMRQTLDEALRNADPSPEGLRAVHDRSRSLQERQRHARPSRWRCAASPGRRATEGGHGQSRSGRAPWRRRIPGDPAWKRRHRPARIARSNFDRAGLTALS